MQRGLCHLFLVSFIFCPKFKTTKNTIGLIKKNTNKRQKHQQKTKTSNDKQQTTTNDKYKWSSGGANKNNEFMFKMYAYNKGEKQFGEGLPVPISQCNDFFP